MHSAKAKLKSWVPVSLTVILLLIIIASGCTGQAGPQGPSGPAGPAGPQGPAGPAATTPPPAPAPVVVSAGTAQTAQPGASVSLKADVKINNGSSIQSYQWTQVSGVKATLENAGTDTAKVTLSSAAAYKDQLMASMEIMDRVMVQPINPHALIAAETATFKVTVTTSSGTYSGNVNVTANLPYIISTGLSNVAKGEPVLLSGKVQAAYEWAIAGPTGSTATIRENMSRNPSFTPDVVGKYTLTEKKSAATLEIYAGTWAGAITGQNAQGQPLSANCTTCHNGTVAADQFTAWRASGHAAIFTDNINNPAGHWTASCAGCHTVGYNPEAVNNGFDEAMAAEKWVVPPHGDIGYWTMMLSKFPKATRLANIQCENCHGPNDGSTLHANGKLDASRISIASDLCGSCHGEPPRHGRFQQWEESLHSNFETAIAEGTRASCARCHTAQGFLAWMDQGVAYKDNLTKNLQGAKKTDGTTADATAAELASIYGITADTTQPITCAVCHDPHKLGSVSSASNNVILRVQGDTPMLPSGFKAINVGNGAMCITCHNSRNGARSDQITVTAYGGPHAAAQGDVLMGQNAYFISTPERSSHAAIENTCTNCHMVQSSAPADISMAGQTNHTFTADINMCGKCHTETLSGEAFQQGIKDRIEAWKVVMATNIQKKLPDKMTLKAAIIDEEVTSDAFTMDKTNIVSVATAAEPVIRQLGFVLTLKSPVSVTYTSAGAKKTVSLTSISVSINNMFAADGTTAVIPLTDNLVKAGWNYMLVLNDSSLGVHNPSFVNDIIDGTIKALN